MTALMVTMVAFPGLSQETHLECGQSSIQMDTLPAGVLPSTLSQLWFAHFTSLTTD